mmetsp:Transcript_22296/g.29161  ORF Transcript_22296/g.29161 Transcript_22296/m.29161 type:complete len:129 (-) Transcript_22296:372-758(-)
MGKKNVSQQEVTLSKKEEKKVRKMRALITFHEARGGNRPGKVGDKRGEWSENLDYDQVCLLKEQIEEIHVNAQKRSWGHDGAKKDMGTRAIKNVFTEKKKRESAPNTPQGSPTSVLMDDVPHLPALAI